MAIIYTYLKIANSDLDTGDLIVITDVSDSNKTKQVTVQGILEKVSGVVTSVDCGGTGLAPVVPTSGAVVISGTLNKVSGGTGLNSYNTGDILYGTNVPGDSLVRLGVGTEGYVMKVKGGLPSWGPLSQMITLSINGGMGGPGGAFATTNATDFLVPYNNVVGSYNAAFYSPTIVGGLGNQGKIEVKQDGKYAYWITYSSQELYQNQGGAIAGPTNADAFVFLRITLSVDAVATGVGGKERVIDQHIVSTSLPNEASAGGAGIIELEAGSFVGVVGYHTGAAAVGAAAGSGPGAPVDNNLLFNQPTITLAKLD